VQDIQQTTNQIGVALLLYFCSGTLTQDTRI